MQPSRLYPFATIIAAATAIALTTLPWISLRPGGVDASWNGLGIGGSTELAGLDFAPAGRGWLIVAAAAVAILAALISLAPAVQGRPVVRLANTIGAGAAVLGALVPVAVMIWPSWYSGNLLDEIGLGPLSDSFPPSKTILIPLAVVMLLTAVLCAATAAQPTADETPSALP